MAMKNRKPENKYFILLLFLLSIFYNSFVYGKYEEYRKPKIKKITFEKYEIFFEGGKLDNTQILIKDKITKDLMYSVKITNKLPNIKPILQSRRYKIKIGKLRYIFDNKNPNNYKTQGYTVFEESVETNLYYWQPTINRVYYDGNNIVIDYTLLPKIRKRIKRLKKMKWIWIPFKGRKYFPIYETTYITIKAQTGTVIIHTNKLSKYTPCYEKTGYIYYNNLKLFSTNNSRVIHPSEYKQVYNKKQYLMCNGDYPIPLMIEHNKKTYAVFDYGISNRLVYLNKFQHGGYGTFMQIITTNKNIQIVESLEYSGGLRKDIMKTPVNTFKLKGRFILDKCLITGTKGKLNNVIFDIIAVGKGANIIYHSGKKYILNKGEKKRFFVSPKKLTQTLDRCSRISEVHGTYLYLDLTKFESVKLFKIKLNNSVLYFNSGKLDHSTSIPKIQRFVPPAVISNRIWFIDMGSSYKPNGIELNFSPPLSKKDTICGDMQTSQYKYKGTITATKKNLKPDIYTMRLGFYSFLD